MTLAPAAPDAGNAPMEWLRLYDRWRILPLMVVLVGLAVMVTLAYLTEARLERYPIVTVDAVAVDPAERCCAAPTLIWPWNYRHRLEIRSARSCASLQRRRMLARLRAPCAGRRSSWKRGSHRTTSCIPWP